MQVNGEDKGLVPSTTILRINKQATRLPPVLGEFALRERGQLLERIAELEGENKRLRALWSTTPDTPTPAPGFVLAPLEPTEAMRIPSYTPGVPWHTRARIYRDMVATLLGSKP
jgi:hypothetical protein